MPATSDFNSLIHDISSMDADNSFRAIKTIKNAVIGNRSTKLRFVEGGIIPWLVKILSDSNSKVELKIEASVILGSVAHGIDSRMCAQDGVILNLLKNISSSQYELVEASARALKVVLANQLFVRKDIIQSSYMLALVSLLDPNSENSFRRTNNLKLNAQSNVKLSELAASIIARIAVTHEEQIFFANIGAIPNLCNLLQPEWSSYSKVQEAALDALASVSRENVGICKSIVGESGNFSKSIGSIFKLLRDCRPSMRLLASTCLTNLFRAGTIPQSFSSEIHLVVLPTLINLFSENSASRTAFGSNWPTIQEKAPLVFACLVGESEELQKVAMESDAIHRLVAIIMDTAKAQQIKDLSKTQKLGSAKKGQNTLVKRKASTDLQIDISALNISGSIAEKVTESALLGIAAVCSLKEECRKQVNEAKLLPFIVSALAHKNAGIRAAACQCTRSLSRSVKNLRTTLIDAGIATPLFNLLSDESIHVQIMASATFCNIVLDFSPMKKTVVENGGIEKLVGLVNSSDQNLRLNSVWGLKNLLYFAESAIKVRVMKELTWSTLVNLLDDKNVDIQVQSLTLLRNLASGKTQDIQSVFDALGESIFIILNQKLLEYSNHAEIILQTLYILVNLATGTELQKSQIMKHAGLLETLIKYMTHPKNDIRIAVVWICINLSNPDDTGFRDRVNTLENIGFKRQLLVLANDPDMDVKDRVKVAMLQFQRSEVKHTTLHSIQSPLSGQLVSNVGRSRTAFNNTDYGFSTIDQSMDTDGESEEEEAFI